MIAVGYDPGTGEITSPGGNNNGGGGNPAVAPTATLTGTVQSFDKLPTGASVGAIYAISGDADTNFASYYVMKGADGTWDECVKPGLSNAIDPLTMPHALIRQSDGSFVFAPFTWASRVVGDELTNPKPGFIGKPIRCTFFYQNRLAFLYDTNTILSVTGDFGNFWRMTVLDYLDADVLDVSATSTQVAILRDAVPFNDGIMLFSDQTQFSMSNGLTGLSANSVAIKPVTNYQSSPRVTPVSLGSEVYFTSDQTQHAIIWEYTHSPTTDYTSASNVTAHVPRYIPGGIKRLVPAPDVNALFVLTDGAPHSIFVYQFYWVAGGTKAQSAWHQWDLPSTDTILSAAYVGGVLKLIISRGDGVYLEEINLQPEAAPSGFPMQVHLDRRAPLTGGYDPFNGQSIVVVPYDVEDTAAFRAVRSDGGELDHSRFIWEDAHTFISPGNAFPEGTTLVGGQQYEMRYRFSRPYMKHRDGTSVNSGRLQLRTITVAFTDTAGFKTQVFPYGLGDDLPMLENRFVGSRAGQVFANTYTPVDGELPIQVLGDSKLAVVDLVNDTPFGSRFQSGEWEGFYWNRSTG